MHRGQSLRITCSIAGLMIAALLIALGGLYWAASKTDQSMIRYERGLLRNALEVERERVAKEIETFAVNDAAYLHAHANFDRFWVEHRISQRLATATNDTLVAIMAPDHSLRYIAGTGTYSAETIVSPGLAHSLRRMMDNVQGEYERTVASDGAGGTTFAPDYRKHIQAIYDSAFEIIDTRLAFVTVMAIVPVNDTTRLIAGPPSVVINARRIDMASLHRIGNLNRLSNLTFEGAATGDTMPPSTLPLYNGSSRPIGWLSWTPSRHGTSMLDEASPMMVLAMLVLLILAVGVLRHTHVSTVRLAFSEALARHRALHDDLSQLPNRQLFSRRLSEALETVGVEGELVGLIYVDLDYFKEVNDTLGHQAGDELIKAVARRLQSAIGPGDLVSRISGDEFALLVTGRTDPATIIDVCRTIEATIAKPFSIDEQWLHSSCSMGLVIADSDTHAPAELLRRADIALYRAKAEGRSRYVLFQESMGDEIRLSQQMERELRQALEEDQFELLYQPQVSADGRTTLGVEALIRWRHPEKGLLTPYHFMSIVERSDLIWQVGAWVIRTACRDGHAWPDLSVAVNVSPAQIRHPEFARVLHLILQEEAFDPRRFEVEVTESVVMDHIESAARIFESLRHIGVRIALDDFGTGYSSLSYLRRFAFDKFKIDRSFITAVESEPEAAAIVHTLVALADALGMKVTAEGIETEGQHRFVQASGCDQLQGYLFSRPVTAEEITARLDVERSHADLTASDTAMARSYG
ncbi:periplasmic sensor diguanylate cyclase/phosphodiesterase [Breoghania corrubedonensis]|uniref:Periplasmic sensor diguanylate cyclase/phosphodiesterase n=1 Tax=Breoghania corrubedonensis TaxID=665038 RepID=A0A2T5VD83_9HYPH|nr:bifunctional diguanylate cyclase/phosphodiesterase [Breoghania corrubedonensis]PTW61702.1 periplasmic sensor diguanylate cyclase/phosphodiesterase [Breoghania corrubedonensis]